MILTVLMQLPEYSKIDNSENEDRFRIYSNAIGTMEERKTVGADTASATDMESLDSGEYIHYKVTAYNEHGELTGTKDGVMIS